jgi:hypothetical protein
MSENQQLNNSEFYETKVNSTFDHIPVKENTGKEMEDSYMQEHPLNFGSKGLDVSTEKESPDVLKGMRDNSPEAVSKYPPLEHNAEIEKDF